MKVAVTYEVLVSYKTQLDLDDTEVAEWAGADRDPRNPDTLRRFLQSGGEEAELLIEAVKYGSAEQVGNDGVIEYISKVEAV